MTPANTPATPPAFPDTLLSLSKLTTSDSMSLSTSPGINASLLSSNQSGPSSKYPNQRSPLAGQQQQQAALNGHNYSANSFGVSNHGNLSNGHLGLTSGVQSSGVMPSKSPASAAAFLSTGNNHLFNHYWCDGNHMMRNLNPWQDTVDI